MIISFDIDNTLILYSNGSDVEPKPLAARMLAAEPIRNGTRHLFNELKQRGHEIWIYTTSFRAIFKIRKTFFAYGLYPTRIINEYQNQRKSRMSGSTLSKNPSLFGIDVHVDDSQGVKLEGDKNGFRTIIVSPSDKDWVNTVLKEIKLMETNGLQHRL